MSVLVRLNDADRMKIIQAYHASPEERVKLMSEIADKELAEKELRIYSYYADSYYDVAKRIEHIPELQEYLKMYEPTLENFNGYKDVREDIGYLIGRMILIDSGIQYDPKEDAFRSAEELENAGISKQTHSKDEIEAKQRLFSDVFDRYKSYIATYVQEQEDKDSEIPPIITDKFKYETAHQLFDIFDRAYMDTAIDARTFPEIMQFEKLDFNKIDEFIKSKEDSIPSRSR